MVTPGECSRICSYLGLDRAYRRLGVGAGLAYGVGGCRSGVSLTNPGFEGAAGPPPAGWLASSATVTRQSGTRTGGSGSYVCRITYSVTIYGSAYQDILVSGAAYRFTGWARGDGVTKPRLQDNGTSVFWTGTVSNTWQYFDVLGVATTAHFVLATDYTTWSAGHYVEYDDLVIARR